MPVSVPKSAMYGKNPELQPDAEYSYETDPDITSISNRKVTPAEKPEPGGFLPSWLKGAGEAALHSIAGIASAPVSAAAGIYGTLASGKYGTQEGIQAGNALAAKVQQAMLNAGTQPTTEEGKNYLENLQSAFEASKIPPVAPELGGLTAERQMAFKSGINAKQQLNSQFANIKAPKIKIETVPGLRSAGAAATETPQMIKGNIDAALANASPELQAHINVQEPTNVNVPALETRVLEEKHGVDLLKSQRTNNLSDYVQSWNQREANGLSSDFAQQPKQLSQAFEQSKQRHAPRIHSDADASELGQHEINGLVEKDKSRLQNIQNKYSNLKNAYNEIKKNLGLEESNDLPLDGKLFVENSKKTLNSEMFTEDARKSIDELLNKIDDKNGVMTFQEFTTLDKRLSELSKFGKGSEKEAARLTREHLNNMELTEDAAPLYPLLKDAKATAKERFDVIDSNPAYAKAIGEGKDLEGGTSQGESLNAGKFHRQYVSTATPEAIRRLKAELPEDHIAHEAIIYGELDRAKKAIINANESRVKSDQFGDFLRNNKPILKEALSPGAMQDVTEIGFLNSKIGKPDAGTFSHSNTYSAMLGDLAKNGLLTLGETALSAKTGGLSAYPVSMAKKLKEKFDKNSFANEQRNKLGGLIKEQP
jgi:hypothetical protein